MSTNELKRMEILTKLKDKHLRQPKGAKELGISPRQLRRLLRRFIPKQPEESVFDCVGFPSKFLSSLAPWPKAMVARSRQEF